MEKNGLEDYYVIRNQKKMRFGYTTGSCAAGACKGAAEMLLSGKKISSVNLMTTQRSTVILLNAFSGRYPDQPGGGILRCAQGRRG